MMHFEKSGLCKRFIPMLAFACPLVSDAGQIRSKCDCGFVNKLRAHQRGIKRNAGGLRDAVPVPGLMPDQQPMVKKVQNRP
jgi:hypothetical protein